MSTIFWDRMLWSLLDIYRCFGYYSTLKMEEAERSVIVVNVYNIPQMTTTIATLGIANVP